tara:strand:+ start:357 stop:758 length:402 start_codon:yes stop_codon:yes gene_type:complete
MFNITNYFREGIKKTLLVRNNGASSHNGPWKQVYTNTQVERWHAGEFSTAEFTISIDYDNANKEIIKCIVAVGVDYANLSVVGRSNLSNDLVDLSVTVNQSYVDLLITAKTGYTGAKFIYTANYFQNQNPLTS